MSSISYLVRSILPFTAKITMRDQRQGNPPVMSSLGRTIVFTVLLGCFWASPAPIYAQSKDAHTYPAEKPDCNSPQPGFLNVDTNKNGLAEFTLDVCVPSASEPGLRDELPIALGCLPESTDFSVYKIDELTALEMDCEIQLPRKTFQVAGPIDLSSMQSLLKGAGLEALTVDIWLPRYRTPSCTPVPKHEAWSEDGLDCTYFLHDTVQRPRIMYLSFGYDSAHLLRIAVILGFLLFIPIALTIWFRRRAISVPEESRPTVVFAYGRFINATLLGGTLIWWTAIDLLTPTALRNLFSPRRIRTTLEFPRFFHGFFCGSRRFSSIFSASLYPLQSTPCAACRAPRCKPSASPSGPSRVSSRYRCSCSELPRYSPRLGLVSC
jgi:hypothetical protein